MSMPEINQFSFDEHPELLTQLEEFKKTKQQEQQSTAKAPEPLPPVDNTGTMQLVEFQEEKLDDGAKTNFKEDADIDRVFAKWFPDRYVTGNTNTPVSHLVRCINTAVHDDEDPSMDLGHICSDGGRNRFFCRACDWTGDIVDLAAVYFNEMPAGNNISTYDPNIISSVVMKASRDVFPHMDNDNDWREQSPGNWIYDPVPVYDPATVAVVPSAKTKHPGFSPPELDWRNNLPKHTVMYKYMETCCVDEDFAPEEFHFFNFFQLVGMCASRYVKLYDRVPVKANFLITMLGDTGVGKSIAYDSIATLYEKAMPFNPSAYDSDGIKIIHGSGSGENMFKMLRHESPNPNWSPRIANIPKTLVHPGVDGYIYWPELAGTIAKTRDTAFKEQTIEVYDGKKTIGGSSNTSNYIAENAFASIFTTVQPSIARKLFNSDDANSGFLNRFMFIIGQEKPMIPFSDPIDLSHLVQDVIDLREWCKSKASLNSAGKDNAYLLGFNKADSSEKIATEFFHDVIYPLRSNDAILRRADLLFKKILLTCSVLMMEDAITEASVQLAIYIWTFSIKCLEKVSAEVITTEHDLLDSIIEECVKSSMPEGISRSRLYQSVKRKAKSSGLITTNEDITRKIRSSPDIEEMQVKDAGNQRGPKPKKFIYIPMLPL